MKRLSIRILIIMLLLVLLPLTVEAADVETTPGDVTGDRRIVSAEEQERDKLYMGGGEIQENPIQVTVIDDTITRRSPLNIDLKRTRRFEESILSMDAKSIAAHHTDRYFGYRSETETRYVSIDRSAYDLLVSFTNELIQPYADKQVPDLAKYYDTSTKERMENLDLMKNFAFYNGASFSSGTDAPITFNNKLDVLDVIPLEEGFYQIDFLVSTTFSQGSGQYIDHTAYLMQSESGYKVAKYWIGDENFPAFIKSYQKNIDAASGTSPVTGKATIGKKLLDERQRNMEQSLHMKPDQDSFLYESAGIGAGVCWKMMKQ